MRRLTNLIVRLLRLSRIGEFPVQGLQMRQKL
jgi:hypothetical protein